MDRIKWVSVVSVDNALQNIIDLNFIGSTIASGKKLGAKVVKKSCPDEKVGTICRINNIDCIIEYFELPNAIAELTDLENNLVYSYGVTLNYLFDVTYLLQNNLIKSMPLHLVTKKADVLKSANGTNDLISRECYKFESLIIDQVSLLKDVYFYEVDREYEFAPIKNRVGKDSLESAQKMLKNRGLNY